ncbi:MAG: outer membrane protein transport protein, partial [Planctomycetota bacterium]|nr:outer membrane protein transport protein [Planctomycetota bacterium]
LAGQAAIARDASTSWLNPAGLTRLEGTQAMLGLQPFTLNVEFDPSFGTTTTGGDGGDAGDWALGGSAYLSHQLNDDMTFGFSVTVPWGVGLDYDNNWVGRYFVTEVDLIVLNLQPALGVRVNDWFSFGVGLDIQYADFEQDIAVNRPFKSDGKVGISGDNWEVGATIGLLFEPSETTRFGVRYRTEMDHDLSGDFTALQTRDVSSGLTLPQSVVASVYHELNDKWAIMGDVGWTDWSAFDRTVITVNFNDPKSVEIDRNFKDTWNAGLGVHYRPDDRWLLMTGISYVSSAVDNEDRTPDIPVDRQWRYSAGFEYTWSEKIRVGMYYTYIDMGDNKINNRLNPLSGRLVGDYGTAEAHLIGLFASFEF